MEIRASGSYFRLQVVGYQFVDAEGEPYDANWLSIRVDAAGPNGAWSVTDPCLLTYELDRLVEWLHGLLTGKKIDPALSFLEPALLFRVIKNDGENDILRIHFGNLVHPDWSGEPLRAGMNPDIWLDFPLEEIDLISAVQSLRNQGLMFPRRYER